MRGEPRDFRLFWLAGAVDLLGSHASSIVLPLLVLAVGGSPIEAGIIGTVAALARFGVAPAAGVFADRYSRRTLLTWSALVAAAAMGVITVGVAIDRITWPVLLVAGLVEGLAAGCFASAHSGALRRVLPKERQERAVAMLRAREHGAELAGPSLGGFLFQLSAMAPFLLDMVSYLLAATLIRRVRRNLGPDRVESGTPPSFRGEFVAGMRFVFQQPFLRFVTLWAAGVNLILSAVFFHVVLVARLGGASAGAIGLILTISGAAGLLGALAVPRVIARVSATKLVVIVSWLVVLVVVPVAVASSPWQFGLALGAVSLISPMLSVVFQTKAIMITPDRLQSRVGTTLGTVGEGSAAFAPLFAGLLVGAVAPPIIAVVFGVALALLATYATVNRHHLKTPPATEADEPAPDPDLEPAAMEKGA